MINKIFRGVLTLVGVLLGIGIVSGIKALGFAEATINDSWVLLAMYISFGLLFGIIIFILSPRIIKLGKKIVAFLEGELQSIPANEIVLGTIGLIVGLIIAYLLSQPFYNLNIPYIGSYLGVIVSIILYALFAYLGIIVVTRKKDDFTKSVINIRKSSSKEKTKGKASIYPKILDTSVIIDGRIADICKTGFIEGPLIIPEFVLEELQHIADSSDSLKRNRGRRGLDILNKIQKELDIEVIIHDKKFEDVKEVDSKLLKLTQFLDGIIVTNDYNLNKVAEVQGIEVLNINDLANSVKPVVLPGEEMVITVIKDGKESNQGLAYLDDGTMIVVESGKKYIGETINVLVTSVLQTSAGKMIFVKPKSLVDRAV